MSHLIDLKDKKFANWTVIELDKDHFPIKWICQCICGKIKSIHGCSLRSGRSKSCGCVPRKSQRLPNFGREKNQAYKQAKLEAEERNLSWELTLDQYIERCYSNCVYCNGIPKISGKKKKWPRNGVDRLDNSKGYLPWNSVACCWTCNRIKMTSTLHEFLEHIQKIYNHSVIKMQYETVLCDWFEVN